MRDAARTHAGKVKLTVVEGPAAEIKELAAKHELGSHGLVGFGPDGAVKVRKKGHTWGASPEEAAAGVAQAVTDVLKAP